MLFVFGTFGGRFVITGQEKRTRRMKDFESLGIASKLNHRNLFALQDKKSYSLMIVNESI